MIKKETNNKEANEAPPQEPLKEVKPATRNSRTKQKPVVVITEEILSAIIDETPAATEEVTATETIENDDLAITKKENKKKMKDKEKKKALKANAKEKAKAKAKKAKAKAKKAKKEKVKKAKLKAKAKEKKAKKKSKKEKKIKKNKSKKK
ncbi:hypothetical protein [Flavobacterium undicola]|uniref:hypothetical protein n=1 Tax=Flavobacterium undicola TaxID=1932779 RepID=UPI001377FEAA|nr:hypothetical protein [Flavobacterium undicola]MBA0883257.1 hypothetical protein [Flavobacterium undicola]